MRVVIVGGGIAGVNSALALAERGVKDVILLERHSLTAGTTWHAAGLLGRMGASEHVVRARAFAQEHYARLEEQTGMASGLRRQGGLALARSPERLDLLCKWQRVAAAAGTRTELLTPQVAAIRAPLLRVDDLCGALYCAEDGQINPVDVTMMVAAAARSAGATIREGAAVKRILVEPGPRGLKRTVGVELESGEELLTDHVLLCGGLWSRELAQAVGAHCPLWPCEHEYVLTEALEAVRGHPVIRDHDAGLYVKEDAGRLLVGFFESDARAAFTDKEALPREPFCEMPADMDRLAPWLEAAMHRVPALEQVGLTRTFCGPESFTPDGVELLGESGEVSGLFMCTGFNSHGIVMGPYAARQAVDLLLGADVADQARHHPGAHVQRFQAWEDATPYVQERAAATLGATYVLDSQQHQQHQQHQPAKPQQSPWLAAQQTHGAVVEVAAHGKLLPRAFGGEDSIAQASAEARATRDARPLATAADVSDEATFWLRGPGTEAALRRCSLLAAAPDGSAAPGLVLDRSGRIFAPVEVAHIGVNSVLVAAAGRHRTQLRALLRSVIGDDADLVDVSDRLGSLLLHGTDAAAAAQRSGCTIVAPRASPGAGVRAWAPVDAADVFARLLDQGATPIGTRAVRMLSAVGPTPPAAACCGLLPGDLHERLLPKELRRGGSRQESDWRLHRFDVAGHAAGILAEEPVRGADGQLLGRVRCTAETEAGTSLFAWLREAEQSLEVYVAEESLARL